MGELSNNIITLIIVFLFLKVLNTVYDSIFCDSKEQFGSSSRINAEASANLASLYNNGSTVIIPNLKVTGKLEVDGDTTSRSFGLNGNEISHDQAKNHDGILYKADGQAHIGHDDNLYLKNNNNGKYIHIADDHMTLWQLNAENIYGKDVKGKVLRLSNEEISNDDAKNYGSDGIIYRSGGNMHIAHDDNLWIRNFHNGKHIHIHNDQVRTVGSFVSKNTLAARIGDSEGSDHFGRGSIELFHGDYRNLGKWGGGDRGDYIHVSPGFKVKLWRDIYSSTAREFGPGVHHLGNGLVNEETSAKVRFEWEGF
jgi:hypothetical protein